MFFSPALLSFLLVNSVALHGDGCPICQSVEKELIKLSRDLNCSLQVGEIFLAGALFKLSGTWNTLCCSCGVKDSKSITPLFKAQACLEPVFFSEH